MFLVVPKIICIHKIDNITTKKGSFTLFILNICISYKWCKRVLHHLKKSDYENSDANNLHQFVFYQNWNIKFSEMHGANKLDDIMMYYSK